MGGEGCHAFKSAKIEDGGDCCSSEKSSQAGERCHFKAV